MGEAIAVTPTPPGVVVNRPGVIVGMTVEAVSVVNVAVDGRARVGVTALEGAQALIKTKPISRTGKIILFFIFTSQTIISLVLMSSDGPSGGVQNVILSIAKDLLSRVYETLPGTDPPGQVSVAKNAPSHRPEAVSLRERDMVF